jgi:multiple sugar transport system substrate-binding protein
MRITTAPTASGARAACRASLAPVCAIFSVLFLAGVMGCNDNRGGVRDTASGPAASTGRIKLLVVDDPALATAVGRLRGEWQAQSGADFEVVPVSQADVTGAKDLAGDAVLAPSYKLGELAEAKRIAPVPEKLLQGNAASWAGVFSLSRVREAAWGKQVMAVPFGSPVLVCYCRTDLLTKLGLTPPGTWQEYLETAQSLADRQRLGPDAPPESQPWHGAVEPLAPGWAATMLLARVAAYGSHPENESTLFDADTMKPLVDSPPFVRALDELAAAAALGPKDATALDPTATRRTFWEGKTAMAVSWPTAADQDPTKPAARSGNSAAIAVSFVELPGSKEVFGFKDHTWEPRGEEEPLQVPLLAFDGRLGMVSVQSASPELAFQLLLWLSGPERSEQVCPKSPHTTLFRKTHVAKPTHWTEPQIPSAAAAEYGALIEKVLSRSQRLFALRIPGRAEYLSALDEAVHQVVAGQKSSSDSLSAAAKRWEQITERFGRARQRQAYWHSLDLE